MHKGVIDKMGTTVDPVSTVNIPSTAATTKNSSGSNLSMNDFFTLLSAQLQYQDPMQPTDNSQFMAQMAQFSTLEQLQNLSKTMSISTATSSIGKYAVYNATDASGNTTQGAGTVDAVDLTSDTPTYLINGSWISQSNVTQFFSSALLASSGSGSDGTTT